MPILNREKALRCLRKDRVLLAGLLEGLDQQAALDLRDGPDGWCLLDIICHLADFERIFAGRARSMLAQDEPRFPAVDHLALVVANNYAQQDLNATWQRWLQAREAFINWLEGLDEAQLARPGIHPETGAMTILHLAINTVLHDVDHMEQISRVIGRGSLAR